MHKRGATAAQAEGRFRRWGEAALGNARRRLGYPSQAQIFPNPAKPSQRKSKKKAWFSLDFLRRNEPFQ
jgi:hypothetical protein